MGLGDYFSQPLGYVILRVQVEGVKGYDEDQVALVIPDSTTFGSRVPVTLDTPTINWIVNVIKESKRWAICLTEWINEILPTGRMSSRTLP